jgi:hypothetical protein
MRSRRASHPSYLLLQTMMGRLLWAPSAKGSPGSCVAIGYSLDLCVLSSDRQWSVRLVCWYLRTRTDCYALRGPATCAPTPYSPSYEPPPRHRTQLTLLRCQPPRLRYREGVHRRPATTRVSPRKGLIISGAVVLGTTWLLSAAIGAASTNSSDRWLLPVASRSPIGCARRP